MRGKRVDTLHNKGMIQSTNKWENLIVSLIVDLTMKAKNIQL